MGGKLIGAWLVALLLFAPVASAEGITIAVLQDSTVQGPVMTLGEIAEVNGDNPARLKTLREVKIGAVAAPGTSLTMTPEMLGARLIASGADFTGVTWDVPRSFRVVTASQIVGGQRIADAAKSFIEKSIGGSRPLSSGSSVTISLLETPADLTAPRGKLELIAQIPAGIRHSSPTLAVVSVRTDGRPYTEVTVRFEVKRYEDVIVAANTIDTGDSLSAPDLRIERADVGPLGNLYFTDAAKAIGMTARRPIPRGTVLNSSMLTSTLVIKRGATVQIVAKVGDMQVGATGQALNDGAVGDLVRVQNLDTKKIITGRVQADATVLIMKSPAAGR